MAPAPPVRATPVLALMSPSSHAMAGHLAVGDGVGTGDGGIVGTPVGRDVGAFVGTPDGEAVGTDVGTLVGVPVGSWEFHEGSSDGCGVGTVVGADVGSVVGMDVGTVVGFIDGFGVVGMAVGAGLSKVGLGEGTPVVR